LTGEQGKEFIKTAGEAEIRRMDSGASTSERNTLIHLEEKNYEIQTD
jgi:hypothetical protein